MINKLPLCYDPLLCADCVEDSEEEVRPGEGDTPDQTRTQQQQQQAGSLRRSKRFVRKPSVQTETKYIELMVVNDNEMVSLRSDVLQGWDALVGSPDCGCAQGFLIQLRHRATFINNLS